MGIGVFVGVLELTAVLVGVLTPGVMLGPTLGVTEETEVLVGGGVLVGGLGVLLGAVVAVAVLLGAIVAVAVAPVPTMRRRVPGA